MTKDHSFKIKNNKMEQLKDKQKHLRLRTNSVFIPKAINFQKSSKNVKKDNQNKLLLSPYAPKRNYKKMNTVLNLHSDLNMLLGEKKNSKYEKNGDNKGQLYENQELLYSQKFNNFILKIYKTSDSQSQSQINQKKHEIKKNIIITMYLVRLSYFKQCKNIMLRNLYLVLLQLYMEIKEIINVQKR